MNSSCRIIATTFKSNSICLWVPDKHTCNAAYKVANIIQIYSIPPNSTNLRRFFQRLCVLRYESDAEAGLVNLWRAARMRKSGIPQYRALYPARIAVNCGIVRVRRRQEHRTVDLAATAKGTSVRQAERQKKKLSERWRWKGWTGRRDGGKRWFFEPDELLGRLMEDAIVFWFFMEWHSRLFSDGDPRLFRIFFSFYAGFDGIEYGFRYTLIDRIRGLKKVQNPSSLDFEFYGNETKKSVIRL